jgi:dTDP-4-amino-4,6-dideoxygalactose transaminase
MIPRRKKIFETYTQTFSKYSCFQLPVYDTSERCSSFHIYPLRINNITEEERDHIMQKIFDLNVCVNVHFIPLPMLSIYKMMNYNIKNYPVAYDNFSREITLPVYYDLTEEQVQTVIHAVLSALSK